MTREQKITKVTASGIIVNFILMAAKFAAAILGSSAAMMADAVHSAVDILSSFFVLVGLRPFKERRNGAWLCIALSAVLFAVGCFLCWKAVAAVAAGVQSTLGRPGIIAIIMAAVSVGVKEYMFRVARKASAETESGELFADAWHHRADAISSIGSFIGIIGARYLFPMLDRLAAAVICLFILKAAFDVLMDGVSVLSGSECDEKTMTALKTLILSQDKVLTVDSMKALEFKQGVSFDFTIYVASDMTVSDAHEVADSVKAEVEKAFKCRSCSVHVEPME